MRGLIEGVVEITSMDFTTALFIPGLEASFNQGYPCIALRFGFRANEAQGLGTGKIIMPACHGVAPAHRTQKIGVGELIAHDAAGDGRHAVRFLKSPLALEAIHFDVRRHGFI